MKIKLVIVIFMLINTFSSNILSNNLTCNSQISFIDSTIITLKIKKIKQSKEFYIIYALCLENGLSYRIISHEDMKYNCTEIMEGGNYEFILKDYDNCISRYKAMEIGNKMFKYKEGKYIDFYRTENLTGLCYTPPGHPDRSIYPPIDRGVKFH